MAFENPRSSSSDIPDIMDDSLFDLGAPAADYRPLGDCRICRAESTEAEPLFYPCKCSGSIKFVHQECLMEWLSHSQKKYCELCKTPFRFTKLYHPQMPPSLPTTIFLRHLIIHTCKNLILWSRFVLVAFVWLGWLPWSMRAVWRFLFWVADGGWATWQTRAARYSQVDHALGSSRQSIVDPAALPTNSPAALRSSSQPTMSSRTALPSVLAPVSLTLKFGADDPTDFNFNFVTRLLSGALGWPLSVKGTSTNVTSPTSLSPHAVARQQHPSFLSGVDLLNNLTRSSKVNKLLIDTIEGQLITIAVVIAFILIFLIREWVVQQQPGMQLEPEFNQDAAPDARPAADQPAPGEDPAHDVPDAAHQPDHMMGGNARHAPPDAAVHDENANAAESNPVNEGLEPARLGRARPMARIRRRVHFPPDEDIQSDIDSGSRTDLEQARENPANDTRNQGNRLARVRSEGDLSKFQAGPRPGRGAQRPTLPTRDALSRAAEIRRTMEEENPHAGQEWPLAMFMDIWERAERDPSQVIKIIEEENRADELRWIVEVMQRRVDPSAPLPSTFLSRSSECSDPAPAPAPAPAPSAPDEQHSSSSGESWLHVSGYSPDVPTDDGHSSHAASTIEPIGAEQHASKERESVKSSKSHEGTSQNANGDKGKAKLSELHTSESSAPTSMSTSPIATMEEAVDQSNRSSESNVWPSAYQGAERSTESAKDSVPFSFDFSDVSLSNLELRPTVTDNPFHPDYTEAVPATDGVDVPVIDAVDDTRRPEAGLAPQPGTLDRFMDWLWGDMVPEQARDGRIDHQNDEHIVRDIDAEPPFVRVAHEDHEAQVVVGDNPAGDQGEAAPGGMHDHNEQDAIEDGEDFDGVMDLIGMRGPLTALFQNATFSAVLVSATIAGAIWLPYVWGKVVLFVLGHPLSLFVKLPLRTLSALADLIVDLALFFLGSSVHWTDQILRLALKPMASTLPVVTQYTQSTTIASFSKSIAERGLERIAKIVIAASIRFSESDYPIFSIVSHQALQDMKGWISLAFGYPAGFIASVYHGSWSVGWSMLDARLINSLSTTFSHEVLSSLRTFIDRSGGALSAFVAVMTKPNALNKLLDIPVRTIQIDPNLAYWGTADRIIAIFAGYAFFSFLGALYLKKRTPFSTSEDGKRVEGIVSDILQQAGGVLKVILIISIEMIAFPLYCGMLLDLALLPLFERATIVSRVTFTTHSPWTSAFVHWFVGTCYMFHFALFVSMCRKIMRNGVLYFIRDPDDPTFHPVRDVLERNVVTQLRKITFSALVYGGLVIVCLGGVVWGLAYTFDGVLPIHWSSNEPVLEFPVDLLFYNFLMPLAVKVFKPSDGLHAMYTWWFRKCARLLRLSWFLFGERREDEEGRHVRRTWWHMLSGQSGDFTKPVIGEDRRILAEDRNLDAYFLRDGRYVRTPASDQVRIPRGGNVFIELDENGRDRDDSHRDDSGLFTKVYIPPFFGVRIALFVFLIWIFAAITGVGITIVPLVFGRMVFAAIIPSHLRMNDVYAFSIGIYMLGGLLYGGLCYEKGLAWVMRSLEIDTEAPREAARRLYDMAVRGARLLYTYAAFGIVLPSLFALLIEFYIIIPLHTLVAADEKHIIHFIQDWTLGVLYIKMAGRLILWYSNSRPAEALQAVMRRGWANPDIRIATRCFILPGCVVMVGALIVPLPLGWLANTYYFYDSSAQLQSQVYRYSYPAVLLLCLWTGSMFLLGMVFESWRRAIRDEVYLIGERLHNFGEKKAGGPLKAGE